MTEQRQGSWRAHISSRKMEAEHILCKATGNDWKSKSLPTMTHLFSARRYLLVHPKQFYSGNQVSNHRSLSKPFWCKPSHCFSGGLVLIENAAKEEIISLILDCAHKSGFLNSPSLPFSFFPHPVTFLSPFLPSLTHLTLPLVSSNCLSLCFLSFFFSFSRKTKKEQKWLEKSKRLFDPVSMGHWSHELLIPLMLWVLRDSYQSGHTKAHWKCVDGSLMCNI